MNPQMLALLAQLGPAAIQFFQGVKQSRQASDMAKNIHDPIMPIPAAAQEALASARTQAGNMSLPGETAITNRMDQTTANSTSDILKASKSPLDALAALTTVNANGQNNDLNLAMQRAGNYNQNQGMLRGQLGTMSNWENAKWGNDVLNKFNRDAAAASALKNAGAINKFQAFKGLANGVGTFAGGMNPKSTTESGNSFDNYNMNSAEQPEAGLQMPQMGGQQGGGFNPGSYTPEQLQSIMEYLKSGGNMSQTLSYN